MWKVAMALLMGGALGGCTSSFLDTAESPKQGWTYVSGQHNTGPAVWLCPTSGGGECHLVPVTVIE